LRELIERPLGNLKLCAVMIDGIAFDGETFVVALGIGQDGRKTVLGLPTSSEAHNRAPTLRAHATNSRTGECIGCAYFPRGAGLRSPAPLLDGH